MTSLPPPVPDRIRYRAVRSRPRRRSASWILSIALTATVLLVPSWTVRRVEIQSGTAVPESVIRGVHTLHGTSVFALDLHWIRTALSRWPGVASAEVRLEPSGVLRIRCTDAPVVASLAIGRGWHGVLPNGSLGPQLQAPNEIAIVDVANDPAVLRQALRAVARVRPHLHAHSLRVTSALPGTFRIEALSATGACAVTLELAARPTAAERAWLELVASDRLHGARWFDLRGEHRLVVRTAETAPEGSA